MKIIHVRNANEALPYALQMLEGPAAVRRPSRVGEVLQWPETVVTSYWRPQEKLILHEARDYNVAFCLYEILWMLQGRRDAKVLDRYVSDFSKRYSDDGITMHGAYGFRWRNHFFTDQLEEIAGRLRHDPDDRRTVLQMWDANVDFGQDYKDVPCNTIATFQRDTFGRLNLSVFCRSNDVLWGAYYANAFQFGTLIEYVANEIGCEVGLYEQISVNFHVYTEVLRQFEGLPRGSDSPNFYVGGGPDYTFIPMPTDTKWFMARVGELMNMADTGRFKLPHFAEPWMDMAFGVLYAHHLYRTLAPSPARYTEALAVLDGSPRCDVTTVMTQWIQRRQRRWEERNA